MDSNKATDQASGSFGVRAFSDPIDGDGFEVFNIATDVTIARGYGYDMACDVADELNEGVVA